MDAQELEALAARYLDLWERQLATIADDPAAGGWRAALVAALQQATCGAAEEEPPRAVPDQTDTER